MALMELFGRPPGCDHPANSTKKGRTLAAPSPINHNLRMTWGRTLLSLVRSRVVAQLERCGCPILYTAVPKLPFDIILAHLSGIGETFCQLMDYTRLQARSAFFSYYVLLRSFVWSNRKNIKTTAKHAIFN